MSCVHCLHTKCLGRRQGHQDPWEARLPRRNLVVGRPWWFHADRPVLFQVSYTPCNVHQKTLTCRYRKDSFESATIESALPIFFHPGLPSSPSAQLVGPSRPVPAGQGHTCTWSEAIFAGANVQDDRTTCLLAGRPTTRPAAQIADG